MCITIDVVQPHWVTTPSVPNNTHEPGAQNRGDGNNAATADDDGEKAVAVQVGGGQDDLASSPPDFPHDRATLADPCLLDQSDVPWEGCKVRPTLCKATKVGSNDARAGVASLPNAVEASAFATGYPRVPRGSPVMQDNGRWQPVMVRVPVEGLPRTEEALARGGAIIPVLD